MYVVKILGTQDPQLDHLNIVLYFNNKEDAFKQADVFIQQYYTVQIYLEQEKED